MNALPSSWAEALERFAGVFGGGEEGEAIAAEWLREACEASWGVQDVAALPRHRRARAFQLLLGTVFRLEEQGDLAFVVGIRRIVAGEFARLWSGIALHGPPWRLDPAEMHLPTREEWRSAANFGNP